MGIQASATLPPSLVAPPQRMRCCAGMRLLILGHLAAYVHTLARSPSTPLCAIGDLHGDMQHALTALRLCGAVDEDGQWSGGTMTVVQLGDVVDRGNASMPLVHK